MLEPFIIRAILAGVGLAIVAAPLGCLVVWRRMAYFGSTVAHAGLLGVALGLVAGIDLTVGIIIVSLLIGVLLIALERQKVLPIDTLLGLLSHAALAGGLVAASKLAGQRLDLIGYLFGDILAVSRADLLWIWGGGGLVLAVTGYLWPTLVATTVHAEIAAAEGHGTGRAEAAMVMLIAFTIAIAMKIVGVLLVIAFLVMPAAAARPFAATPERMAVAAAVIGALGTIAGLLLSVGFDIPTGPAIVLVLSAAAFAALLLSIVHSED
ncbi:MAG TPA: metal ABC transporter permease [Hyphomicrobiaceae bacterium]|nr:metal ABC transporter permease [Hyphomicrobiaceae bacterium]